MWSVLIWEYLNSSLHYINSSDMSCLVREENMFSATLAEGWLRSLHAKHKRTLWKTDLLLTCWACQAITNSIKNVMNHICFWAKREREREENWCWGWRHAKIQMIKELDVQTIRGRHTVEVHFTYSLNESTL